MSSYMEELRRANREGTLETFKYEPAGQESEPGLNSITPPVNIQEELPADVIEAVTIAEDEISTGKYLLGTGLGAAGELGTGLLATKLHRSQKVLKWLSSAKKMSALGVVTPEPASTVGGVIGFGVTEAGIWATSNLIGQSIRKEFGLQGEYSAGEAIAASVFGVGLVTQTADKVFRLSPGIGAADAWKGKELVVNGVKTFMSGAALGLAESALRQEIEAQLNGADRNIYDYIFSSVAGGSFNTMFTVWARTGKWGRGKAKEAVEAAKENLEQKKQELQKVVEESDEPLPTEVAFGLGGGAAQASKSVAKNAALKQIQDINQAQASLDDSIQQIVDADAALSKQETNPTVKEEVDPEVEDVTAKLEEEGPIVVRDEEADSIEEPSEKIKPEKSKEPEEPVVEEPPARERTVEDKREDALDELLLRIKNSDITPETGNASQELPKINREGKKIYDQTLGTINGLIRVFTKNPTDKNIANALLNEIKFMRTLNVKVVDWLNTIGGRVVQSQRGDSDQYAWATKYSERANLQDEALVRLQATLEAKTRGVVDGDEADIQAMFDEYLAIPDQLKGRQRKPVETEEDEFIEVFKETKAADEIDVEKPTKEVKQSLGKRKKKLQEKLSELQQRFGDRSKLALAETGEELPEDADIADLKQRIKFYEQAEADALELEKLEAELAKVAELDVAPLGEQRAAVTPKPTGPKKVSLKAAQLRKRIAAVKSNIKQRLADIDKARREMSEDFQAEQAEKVIKNKLNTLQQELDELRTTFGKEPEELIPAKIKEKDPRVKDLEDKIKFYKEAQAEIKKIKDLEAERARLLEIETGPLGRQREEITPKPTGPKKAPGRVEQLNKDIAFLRSNMRNRVNEIDKARVQMSDEYKAEQLRKAYEKQRSKLEGELETMRKRFADIDAAEEAAGLKVKKKKKKDPRIAELEAKVAYYREAEKEALAVVELEKELARLADIEGRGVIGEVRAEVTPTPKGPTKPARSQELRKKIADSKARMRQKLADLDRARKQIEEERLTARAFKELEEAFYKSLEADGAGWLTKGIRYVRLARQLSLIDQLPSVFAGVPTGIGAVAKQFFRPVSTFLYNPYNSTLPVRTRLAMADAAGAFKVISDLKGLWAEARRTFVENISAVDGRAGRLSDEINPRSMPRGEHALVSRAYKSAERRVQALENTANWFTNAIKNGQFFQLWTLGVRGIQTVDSVFKRQLIKGRLYAESQKKALLEFPNDPVKAKAKADELYDNAWKDSDGLAVLADEHDFEDTVNQIREELLFAADGDLEDMPINSAEKLIKKLKDLSNDDGKLAVLVDAFLPYIGVPIRAVYRGARFSLAPAVAPLAVTPGVKSIANPFSKKIKELDRKLKAQYERLRKTTDPEATKNIQVEIDDLARRKSQAEARRIKYNEEIITDSLLSTSLYFIGGTAALSGAATGSLEWLTPDQRQKNKLESFQIMGSDYSAALPWSFPIALAADVMTWVRIKNEERETGQTILTKDQTLDFVIGASFKKLAEAMPLAQGIETAQEIAKFEGDVTKNAVARLVASYVPIPAQARKITQTILQEGVPDLRGQGYWERIAYSAFGLGTPNVKTDLLGEDLESSHTWVTQTIVRQAPRKPLDRTLFDEIVATDTHGNIARKPSNIADRLPMTDFINEEGITLAYAFDQKLKMTTLYKKGRKLNINQAVNELIASANWNKKYNKGFQEKDGAFVNEGLKDLNKLLSDYYKQTTKDILKDKLFLSSFINDNEENLNTILQARGTIQAPQIRPMSPFEIISQ